MKGYIVCECMHVYFWVRACVLCVYIYYHTYIQMYRERERERERERDRQTDRQTERQTDRETETEMYVHIGVRAKNREGQAKTIAKVEANGARGCLHDGGC